MNWLQAFHDDLDAPVIVSPLDNDVYKFTMGQFVFHRFGSVPVRYGLTNRTRSVRLADIVDEGELRRELDRLQALRFTERHLRQLRGTLVYSERLFREDYLQHLAQLEFPPYELRVVDGQYDIQCEGRWADAIYWEVPALAIVKQLYRRALLRRLSRMEREAVFADGVRRLVEKIRLLRANSHVTFSEFGTRRRFSRKWQDYVIEMLAEELPKQFRGPSNFDAAVRYGLEPMGTNAHEIYMVMACIMHDTDDLLRESVQRVLREWWSEYGVGLSIFLPDTFGTPSYLDLITPEQARAWKGMRQDSMDPVEFGEREIAFYDHHGVDPRSKIYLPSDGLVVPQMIALGTRFHQRLLTTFGWGTDATDDLGFPEGIPGSASVSLVVKAIEANGHPCVKISDNPAKAMGPVSEVERYQRVFHSVPGTRVECRS